MKNCTHDQLRELTDRYKALKPLEINIENAFDVLNETYKSGGCIFTCGNGGSAADSEHIVGELMKKFKKVRPIQSVIFDKLSMMGDNGKKLAEVLEGAIPSVSLTSHISLSTAFSNDKEPSAVFAQQLFGLGKQGDSLLAITTSGNSLNCIYAAMIAKVKGIKVIVFTGEGGGKIKEYADVLINVPEKEVFKIQEYHLPIYHALCAMLEAENF